MEGRSKQKKLNQKTWNKLYTNEYIDKRQTLANTHGLPARELPVCHTNSDELLRFVLHQLKEMYIYESSYIHGKEQRYWNEDRDFNPNTSSVGPLDSPQLYWGVDRNRKTGITNITLVKGHCTDRPAASRTARFTNKMQTDCRYIMYELEPLYEQRQTVYIYDKQPHVRTYKDRCWPLHLLHKI